MNSRDICLGAAKGPDGVKASDLDMPPSTASKSLRKLLSEGLIYRAGHHKDTRYFDTAARASEYDCRTVRAAPKRTGRPGWGRDDPCVITAETKVTIAPAPPRCYRTNTWSPMG